MEALHLLPNGASKLERDISSVLDRTPELAPGIESIRGFKYNPTDSILPYLIIEYGLSEIDGYLPDLRAALAEGIVWQRLRGTTGALHRALRWNDSDGTIEENPVTRVKWWWFQVHLPEEKRSSAFARPMTALANASKPLRSEFARVTSGYDRRGFNLNGHRLNGGGLLNSWSGIRKNGVGPVLSLRVNHREHVDTSEQIELSVSQIKKILHTFLLDGSASTDQRSSFPSSFGARLADYSDPETVPFSNAPFTDEPFGAPIPIVQTGY